MKILGLDPALNLTGWATLIDNGPDGLLDDYGLIHGSEEKGLDPRGRELVGQVQSLIKGVAPDLVVVELPADGSQGSGGYGGRAAMSGPPYGFAVGCVFAAALAMGVEVRGVSVSRWAKGLPKGDDHKSGRVRAAQYLYGLPEGKLGAKTTAGNIADAILLARWVLIHKRQGVLA